MNSDTFTLKIHVNNQLKTRVIIMIDDNIINGFESDIVCELKGFENHSIVVFQECKATTFSKNRICIYEHKGNRKYDCTIVATKWSSSFKLKKNALLNIDFKRHCYTNYLGYNRYYYLGEATLTKGIIIDEQKTSINWSLKQRKKFFSLIELKNTFLFLIVACCFGYQMFEGYSYADGFIVGSSYNGYLYMIVSGVFLLYSVVIYLFFSYRLYMEYKGLG